MKRRKNALKVILIILAVAGLCLYLGLGSVTAEVKNGSMVVKGTLTGDAEIHYSDIKECLLYDSIETGMPSVAFSNLRVKTGQYSSSEYGPYHLMIYRNVQKYIIIKANDSYTIFNCASVDKTVNCFNSIQAALNQLADTPPEESTENTENAPNEELDDNLLDIENESPN